MGKARFGGDIIGPNPTDCGKNGTKRSILMKTRGGPLAIVIARTNVQGLRLVAVFDLLSHRVVGWAMAASSPMSIRHL
jgi:hypothetical protein